jgi:hypothetical protein
MTAQVNEILFLEGEKTSMAFCPDLPRNHPRIIEADPEEDSLGEDLGFIVNSTACWRGYVGTWEIKEGRLFLVSLQGKYQLLGDEHLPAEWVSGVLRVPRGELLQGVNMGFGSVFEEEIHLKIEKGKVVSSRVIDNRGGDFNTQEIALKNLPGGENRFPGDDD